MFRLIVELIQGGSEGFTLLQRLGIHSLAIEVTVVFIFFALVLVSLSLIESQLKEVALLRSNS